MTKRKAPSRKEVAPRLNRYAMFKTPLSLQTNAVTEMIAHIRTPLYLNAYALILSDSGAAILGMLYWILAARYYTTEQVGRDAATIATMIFLADVASVNLKGALFRFIPRAGDATQRIVSYAYLVSLAISLLLARLFVLGGQLWPPAHSILDGSPLFFGWFLFVTIIWSIVSLQDNVLTGLRQTIWVPVDNISFGLLKIILLILFAEHYPTHGIFASWTLPVPFLILLITGLIFGRLIPRRSKSSPPAATQFRLVQIVRFAAGDYIGMLFGMIATKSLPILVISLAGATANAYFYLAWTIAFPLHLVASNLATSLTVEGAIDEGQLGLYARRVFIQILRLLAVPVLSILVGAPFMLKVFGAAYAAQGPTLLRLLTLAALPYSVNAIVLSLARVRNQIRLILAIQGGLCVLVVGLSYTSLLGYTQTGWGLSGMGIAWLASQSIVATILLIRLRKSPSLIRI